MSIRLARSAFPVLFLALGLGSRSIRAATPTASFGVSATVQTSCSISATSIPLGDYPAAVERAKPILITCTNATPYVVDLRTGLASGATVPIRMMVGPFSARVGYEAVSHLKGIVNWGRTVEIDTTAKTGNGFSGVGSINHRTATRHSVAADGYGNFISITVTY